MICNLMHFHFVLFNQVHMYGFPVVVNLLGSSPGTALHLCKTIGYEYKTDISFLHLKQCHIYIFLFGIKLNMIYVPFTEYSTMKVSQTVQEAV